MFNGHHNFDYTNYWPSDYMRATILYHTTSYEIKQKMIHIKSFIYDQHMKQWCYSYTKTITSPKHIKNHAIRLQKIIKTTGLLTLQLKGLTIS